MRSIRLGDDIDDYCVRCKRVMNHAVVSVIAAAPAKVRCRICHSDHDYRHEQAPPPKVDARKAALFHEVLKKVRPDGDEAPVPLPEEEALAAVAAEAVAIEAVTIDPDPDPPDSPQPKPAPKAKAKAKPKAKGKARK